MIERAIENWLISTSERYYQIPLCQVLQLDGHRIIYRSTHGILERGKDIVTITSGGDCSAYQLKTGDITLSVWREIRGEILDLIQFPFVHPDINKSKLHNSYLVTNGEIKDPVLDEIDLLNQDNVKKHRNFSKLNVINGRELLVLFMKAQGTFVPVEIQEFDSILNFYLSDGKENFDKSKYFNLLENVIFGKKPNLPSIAKNAVGSSVILTSYTLKQFQLSQNYFAQFEAWVCLIASLIRYSSRFNLEYKIYGSSLELAQSEMVACLERLHAEVKGKADFLEGNIIGDGGIVRGIRKILVLGAVSALQVYKVKTQSGFKTDSELIDIIKKNLPFEFLGECLFSHIYCIIRFLELCGEHSLANTLLLELVDFILDTNNIYGNDGMANPYYSPDDLLCAFFRMSLDSEIDFKSFKGSSYCLEPLIEMLARRDQRAFIEKNWRRISHMHFMSFEPDSEEDILTYLTEKGSNITRLPKMTQSWSDLRNKAFYTKDIPRLVERNTPFFLFFLIACPNRANTKIIKALDLMKRE